MNINWVVVKVVYVIHWWHERFVLNADVLIWYIDKKITYHDFDRVKYTCQRLGIVSAKAAKHLLVKYQSPPSAKFRDTQVYVPGVISKISRFWHSANEEVGIPGFWQQNNQHSNFQICQINLPTIMQFFTCLNTPLCKLFIQRSKITHVNMMYDNYGVRSPPKIFVFALFGLLTTCLHFLAMFMTFLCMFAFFCCVYGLFVTCLRFLAMLMALL